MLAVGVDWAVGALKRRRGRRSRVESRRTTLRYHDAAAAAVNGALINHDFALADME